MQVETRKKWEQGMDEEIESLIRNKTWYFVKFPARKRALENKWVYRLKEEDGGKKQYKARLVVKGFTQKKGIEFDDNRRKGSNFNKEKHFVHFLFYLMAMLVVLLVKYPNVMLA